MINLFGNYENTTEYLQTNQGSNFTVSVEQIWHLLMLLLSHTGKILCTKYRVAKISVLLLTATPIILQSFFKHAIFFHKTKLVSFQMGKKKAAQTRKLDIKEHKSGLSYHQHHQLPFTHSVETSLVEKVIAISESIMKQSCNKIVTPLYIIITGHALEKKLQKESVIISR